MATKSSGSETRQEKVASFGKTVPEEGELLLVYDLRLGPAQHDETLQLLQRRLRQIERHRHRLAL
jgi:hypothetical protein